MTSALSFLFLLGINSLVGSADKQRADRWRYNNRRAGFDSKRAETRDHHRSIHGVNATLASSSNGLVVSLYEFRPAFFICIRDYRGRKAVTFERDRDTRDRNRHFQQSDRLRKSVVERRMFFHRPND